MVGVVPLALAGQKVVELGTLFAASRCFRDDDARENNDRADSLNACDRFAEEYESE